MRDLALQAAGVLAILVALVHGAIAELHIFAKARIEPPGTRRLLRLIWQASTVDWIGIGVLLIAAPAIGSPAARGWIVAVAAAIYAYAAFGNFMATRGRHIGWVLMSAVTVASILLPLDSTTPWVLKAFSRSYGTWGSSPRRSEAKTTPIHLRPGLLVRT
jgi:hypothetical protein